MFKITSEEYEQHCEDYAGYCSNCEEITQESGVEPDAEGYTCPQCGLSTLMGMEQAMICGLVEII